MTSSTRFRDGDASNLNLSGFTWKGEDFTNCDLRGANLSRSDFKGAKFEGAELRNADLSGSDLTGATNLIPEQLAATNLTRAKLPDSLTKFETLEASAKLADNASKVFLTMLGAVVFTFLTLAMTTDAQLITNNGTTKLPVISTDVPIRGFYWVIPAILLALFIYFHLYLQRLWEALAILPAVFPDGRRLDERSHPWLLTDLVRRHLPRIQNQSLALSGVQSGVSMALGYWAVPFTLAAVWRRLLPLHNWWIIGLHLALLAIGVAFGCCALANRRKTFEDEPAKFGPIRFFHRLSASHGIPAGIVTGLFGLWLSSLALTSYPRSRALDVKHDVDLSKILDIDPTKSWTAELVRIRREALGVRIKPLQADYAEISAKPPNWTGLHNDQEDAQFASVKAARISGVHWAGMSARNAFFAKAELEDVRWPLADLRGADFRDAELRGVISRYGNYATCIFTDKPDQPDLSAVVEVSWNKWTKPEAVRKIREDLRKKLHAASFYGGDFSHSSFDGAQLALVEFGRTTFRKASFVGADLRGTHLELADLGGAVLKYAHLEGADLGGANLEGANLRGVDLHHTNLQGANLEGANLQDANLRGADLEGNNLRGANLEGADLQEANLQGVNFEGAEFGGANLPDADLQGARLRGANFGGAELEGVSLRGADLRGTTFGLFSDLGGADLRDADLRGARLRSAYLQGTDLEGAVVSDLNDLKGIHGAPKGMDKVIVNPKID